MAICYNCFQEKEEDGACPFCGYAPDINAGKYPLALPEGSILNGKYIIGRVLGQGGFGITYVAQEYKTRKLLAIKEYLPGELATRTGIYGVAAFSGQRLDDFAYGKECFLNEAKTIAKFNGNPNIVSVYEFFEENNTAYFVMEYVSGCSLNSYVREKGGRISPDEANRLLLPVMSAVGSVNASGIIHRDIAPDNILIDTKGTAKLIDFGAARYSVGEKSCSLDVILKHGFAPKEQYSKHGVQGPYTDIYAMAATYYYTITGIVPSESIDRVERDDLIAPSALGVKLGEKQEKALLKALELQPMARYQTMEDFEKELRPSDLKTSTVVVMDRAFQALEQGDWSKAEAYLDIVLENEPENARAYLGKLLAELRIQKIEELGARKKTFEDNINYQMTYKYANDTLKAELQGYLEQIKIKRFGFRKIAVRLTAAIFAVAVITAAVVSVLSNKDKSEPDTSVQPVFSEKKEKLCKLIYQNDEIVLPAKEKNYNYQRLDLDLSTNQVYTMSFDSIKVDDGSAPGTGVRLYDFTNNRTLFSTLMNLASGAERFSFSFTTPEKMGTDVALLLYSGIPGSCGGVGIRYSGARLYEGYNSDVMGNEALSKAGNGNAELVYLLDKLNITARDNKFNYLDMNVSLQAGQVYTLCIDSISVTEGSTAGAGIVLYDYTAKKPAATYLMDVLLNSGDYKCYLSVPNTATEDFGVLLYAGIPALCNNVGMSYEGIRLYKGVY